MIHTIPAILTLILFTAPVLVHNFRKNSNRMYRLSLILSYGILTSLIVLQEPLILMLYTTVLTPILVHIYRRYPLPTMDESLLKITKTQIFILMLVANILNLALFNLVNWLNTFELITITQ